MGMKKCMSFGVEKALISLKRGKIALRLLLMTNRKSRMRYLLVPKSVTLDDLKMVITHCAKLASFGTKDKNVNENRSVLSAAKCRPMTLVSGTTRDMWVFVEFPGEGALNNTLVVEISDF